MSDWTKRILDRFAESADPFNIAGVTRETFARALTHLDPDQRQSVLEWALSALEIRRDEVSSPEHKRHRLGALDNTTHVFTLMRALFDSVSDTAPARHRHALKLGVTAAAAAAMGFNFELTGMAMIAMRAAVASFLLSDAGAQFCNLVVEHTAGESTPGT
jgi:hypothetical protein